jgi:hypothetical protein
LVGELAATYVSATGLKIDGVCTCAAAEERAAADSAEAARSNETINSAFSICLTTVILLQIKTPQFDEICDAGLVVCLHLPGEGADSFLAVDA